MDSAINGVISPRGGKTAASAEWSKALAVRLRRTAHGVTLRRLRDLTGYNPETIRRYLKNGRACPGFLAAFAKAFSVSLDWLLLEQQPSHRQHHEPPEIVDNSRGRRSRPRPASATASASQSTVDGSCNGA